MGTTFNIITDKTATVASSAGVNQLLGAQGIQRLAYRDMRNPQHLGQLCFVGQLFMGLQQPSHDGIGEAGHNLFRPACLSDWREYYRMRHHRYAFTGCPRGKQS